MNFLNQSQMMLSQIGTLEILMRMSVALVLASISGSVYSFLRVGFESRSQIILGGIGLSQIITMILVVLSENLFYALGLFAALSIIRFRTPVKSVNDILHLFLCIGIGIACGAGAIKVAAVCTIFILIAQFLYHQLRFSQHDTCHILKVRFASDQNDVASLNKLIETHCNSYSISQVHQLASGKSEHVYYVFPKRNSSLNEISKAVRSSSGVEETIVFATQSPLDF